MTGYLDRLDHAEVPLTRENRVLAALGPKMLELARTRTAGTHPYLVTPELTARARAAVGLDGLDGLVAREQGVVLETDPIRARATARLHLDLYLGLPNYSNAWKRQGFTDDDLANGGSDRLVDSLVVWGDEATIATRIKAHRDAGADHVCIQVLTDDPPALPTEQWRALAPALTA
jgi:probable F420-dependent oxidoreductase